MQFTLGFYGDGDFFTMKGVIEEFFEKVGMSEKPAYDPTDKKPFLHPGRQADIVYNGTVMGYLGELHPDVADNYKIGEKAYVAVIDMPALIPCTTFDRKYTGIAKYPAVTRDLSMVMKKYILAVSYTHLEEYEEYGVPYDMEVLEAAKDGWMNTIHAHGPNIMLELLKNYPVDVFNWHAWETYPAVDEASLVTGKCLSLIHI